MGVGCHFPKRQQGSSPPPPPVHTERKKAKQAPVSGDRRLGQSYKFGISQSYLLLLRAGKLQRARKATGSTDCNTFSYQDGFFLSHWC